MQPDRTDHRTATFTMTRATPNKLLLDADPEDGSTSWKLGNTTASATLQITGVQLYDATNGL